MSCANHPVQDADCSECRLEALDREMDNDLRSAIYGDWFGSLEERQAFARKYAPKWPEPTK